MRRVWLETSFAVAKRVVNRGWHTFALAKGYSARNAIPRVVDLPSVASSTTTFPLFSFLFPPSLPSHLRALHPASFLITLLLFSYFTRVSFLSLLLLPVLLRSSPSSAFPLYYFAPVHYLRLGHRWLYHQSELSLICVRFSGFLFFWNNIWFLRFYYYITICSK